MPPIMLITSAALAAAVIGAAISLRNLRVEIVSLRESMRRAGAINVALYELDREASSMAVRVALTKAEARDRLRAARSRHDRPAR